MLNEFLFTEEEEADIGNIWFQQDVRSAPHSQSYALSAAELMAFGHLGAAIRHRWTIICGVSPTISKPETFDSLKDNIREAIGTAIHNR